MSKTDFVLGLLVMATALGAVHIWDSTAINTEPMPEEETNVTCWVENDTARVICPDRIYAPNSVINISVKPCSEYQFASDEPHPCASDTNSEGEHVN
jgi:hypothetical protein